MNNIKTTVTNQYVNDVKKVLNKNDYTLEEKIKISIAFGEALSNKNFKEDNEYYQFIKEFEKHIENLV